MSAHTPGPWTARKSRGLNSYEINAIGAYLADVWGADDPVPNGVPRKAVKANAHLIAAAPDLLAAIKALLAASMYRDHPAESDMAIAAIAKAEGKR